MPVRSRGGGLTSQSERELLRTGTASAEPQLDTARTFGRGIWDAQPVLNRLFRSDMRTYQPLPPANTVED